MLACRRCIMVSATDLQLLLGKHARPAVLWISQQDASALHTGHQRLSVLVLDWKLSRGSYKTDTAM